jgi:hypothetical protein
METVRNGHTAPRATGILGTNAAVHAGDARSEVPHADEGMVARQASALASTRLKYVVKYAANPGASPVALALHAARDECRLPMGTAQRSSLSHSAARKRA